jgi:hypothetical protein
MPAYVIFVRDTPIRDGAEMAEYQRLAILGMASGEHKVISRVGPGPIEAFEGEAPTGVVLRRWKRHGPGTTALVIRRRCRTGRRRPTTGCFSSKGVRIAGLTAR